MTRRKTEADVREYIEKQVRDLGIDIDKIPFEQLGAEMINMLGANIIVQIRGMRIEMLRDPAIRELMEEHGKVLFNATENLVQFILQLNLDYKGSPFSRHHRLFVDLLALIHLYISGSEEDASNMLRREAASV